MSNRGILKAAGAIIVACIVGCSSSQDPVSPDVRAKDDGSITSNGAGAGTVPYTLSWYDCDGNLNTADMELHYSYYFDPVGDGLRMRSSWTGHGTGLSADGSEVTLKDNGNVKDFSSEDGCLITGTLHGRLLVTQKGAGRTYWLKVTQKSTLNVCTGEFTLELYDLEVDCN